MVLSAVRRQALLAAGGERVLQKSGHIRQQKARSMSGSAASTVVSRRSTLARMVAAA